MTLKVTPDNEIDSQLTTRRTGIRQALGPYRITRPTADLSYAAESRDQCVSHACADVLLRWFSILRFERQNCNRPGRSETASRLGAANDPHNRYRCHAKDR